MNSRSTRALPAVFALAAAMACGAGDSEAPPETPAAAPPAAASQAAPTPPPQQPPAAPAPSGRRDAAKVAYAGALPPLPVTNFPTARPPEIVNAVYEFAARRPDVLRYVPCFCGCERNGHVHNEHCFVASREADGKPRWDAHGMS